MQTSISSTWSSRHDKSNPIDKDPKRKKKNENIFEHLKKKQMIVILNVKMFVSKQYDNELSKHISQWLSFMIYCNFTI